MIKISFNKTISLILFGNSIPSAFFPGITEIRAETALKDLAISSDKPITREDFVPGNGSNSNNVITGPTK